MIVIDGSEGEGGGQVLRTALALSLVTGQPFRIDAIRARRERPGLLRQHLTCVRAATEIGGAEVEGAELGSSTLVFRPGTMRPGSYRFAVGTAGSVGLVLQAMLPAMLVADGTFELEIEGGTHAQSAPPFEFVAQAFLPILRRMGADVDVTLHRRGFYPAGGGRLGARVTGGALRPVEILERGDVTRRQARALVAHLPFDIAEREIGILRKRLGWSEEQARGETVADSVGPGNAVMLEIDCQHASEVISAFGSRGRSAEAVAEDAVQQARRYLAADVPVGEYLADQLLVPMALAGGGSFRTMAPSRHALTNIDVIRRFLHVTIAFESESPTAFRCQVGRP